MYIRLGINFMVLAKCIRSAYSRYLSVPPVQEEALQPAQGRLIVDLRPSSFAITEIQ